MLLFATMLTAGCREPRNEASGTRTRRVAQTRSSVTPPPGASQPSVRAVTRENLTGAEELDADPECSLALHLEGGMVDCSFPTCPRAALASLVRSSTLNLVPSESNEHRWSVVPIRDAPPLHPEVPLVLDVRDGDLVVALPGTRDVRGVGTCTASRSANERLQDRTEPIVIRQFGVRMLSTE